MKLFNLALNTTGIAQGIYRDIGDFMQVAPGCVVDLYGKNAFPPGFTPVKNFMGLIESLVVDSFYIQRTFALGDTLMGVPVVRYLRDVVKYNVWMRSATKFTDVLLRLGIGCDTKMDADPKQVGLMMDWILERDHGNSVLNKFHRVDIYFQALGIDMPRELDWSWDEKMFPANPVEDEPYVVFVGWGANNRKQLPVPTIEAILRRLSAEGIKVYYSGNPSFSWDLPNIVPTSYLWTVAQMFPALAGARCFITMDTGPLWISHFTKTPTICILGPTGSEVHRTALHPLYPEGMVSLKMNEWINCPTCFEHAAACNNTVRCLNDNAGRLVEEVAQNVKRFWS